MALRYSEEKQKSFCCILGHNYEWIITKQPTEEETGLKHEECSRCHDKKNET